MKRKMKYWKALNYKSDSVTTRPCDMFMINAWKRCACSRVNRDSLSLESCRESGLTGVGSLQERLKLLARRSAKAGVGIRWNKGSHINRSHMLMFEVHDFLAETDLLWTFIRRLPTILSCLRKFLSFQWKEAIKKREQHVVLMKKTNHRHRQRETERDRHSSFNALMQTRALC